MGMWSSQLMILLYLVQLIDAVPENNFKMYSKNARLNPRFLQIIGVQSVHEFARRDLRGP